MTEVWKGLTVPLYTDAADGPGDFRRLVDSGPIPRFATVAARDSAIPAPVKGQVVFRSDAVATVGGVEFYNGTVWQLVTAGLAPTVHNHTAAQTTSGAFHVDRIPALPASKITSGTIAAARLPAATSSVAGIIQTDHGHTGEQITSGSIASARVPGLASKLSWVAAPNPAFKQINDVLVLNGATTYAKVIECVRVDQTAPSSLAYKINVGPVKPGSVFDRLSPISFQYKDTPGMERMGFTYEEMVKVAPQWARDTGEVQGVNYYGMIPDFMAWALATIRDLQARLSWQERATLG